MLLHVRCVLDEKYWDLTELIGDGRDEWREIPDAGELFANQAG